jgi:hypothetical protein
VTAALPQSADIVAVLVNRTSHLSLRIGEY